MAKKKDNVSADADNIAVNEPVEETLPVSLPTIESEADALAFVKANYVIPEGIKTLHVTQDKNVFFPADRASAVDHAVKRNLKLFSIQWD